MRAFANLLEMPLRYSESKAEVSAANRLLAINAGVKDVSISARRSRRVSGASSLLVALENAQDLGPDVSSVDPHAFVGRGVGWFD
jgi:hypothetical protein